MGITAHSFVFGLLSAVVLDRHRDTVLPTPASSYARISTETCPWHSLFWQKHNIYLYFIFYLKSHLYIWYWRCTSNSHYN